MKKSILKRSARPLIIAISIFLGFQLISCRAGAPSVDRVILITLDTTRADHIGCYGYGRIKTPNLDMLAREGVMFEDAICQVPITLPSHVSILTGLYPPEFDVRDNTGYVLRESILTLPEILKEKEYATGAVVSSFALSRNWGIAQGFESFSEPKEEREGLLFKARKADFTISAALNWLGGNEDRPSLLWIHLFDPHAEYEPPPPFSEMYKDSPYDGEIAFMDSQIGRLWDFLKKEGIWDNALIIVVGDHGEGLLEHNELRHGTLLYDSTVRIPLIIKAKGFPKGRKVSGAVGTVDILPTILDYLKIGIPEHVRGQSLLPFMLGEKGVPERDTYIETLYPRIIYGWSELKAIQRGKWKYIDAPKPELYDLEKDPGEISNLFRSEPGIADQLSARLRVLEGNLKSLLDRSSHNVPDDKSRQALLSLGYISSNISEQQQKKLEDPKDLVFIEGDIEKAVKAAEKKDFAGALRFCDSILVADPGNKAAGIMRAQAFISMGQEEKAISALKNVLLLYRDNYVSAGLLGKLYIDGKRFSEAEKVFLKALKYHPESYDFTYGLGVSCFGQNRVNDSIKFLEKAISIDPQNFMSFLMLFRCYQALGMNEKAAECLNKARMLGYRG